MPTFSGNLRKLSQLLNSSKAQAQGPGSRKLSPLVTVPAIVGPGPRELPPGVQPGVQEPPIPNPRAGRQAAGEGNITAETSQRGRVIGRRGAAAQTRGATILTNQLQASSNAKRLVLGG